MNPIDDFLQSLAQNGYSIRSITEYKRALLELNYFAIENKFFVERITKIQAREFLVWLQSSGNKSTTINNKLSYIRSFYSFLISCEKIQRNYFSELNRLVQEKNQPSLLSLSEMQNLFETIGANDSLKIRDITMFECFYGSGIQTSELCDLKLEDFSKKMATLHVRKKGGEGRYIPIPRMTVVAIESYLPSRMEKWPNSDYLFPNMHGKRFQRTNVYKLMKNFLDLTSSTKKGAHTLRYSYATHLYNNGADILTIKKLLGHKKPDTTARYIQLDENILKKAHSQAHPNS